jgi:hypothetical protein
MQFKKIATLIVSLAAIFAVPSAVKAIGLSDSQVIGIFLLVAFFWVTHQIEGLKTASGKSWRDDHRKVVQEIEDGKPIEPKHDPPKSIEQGGWESFITDSDRMLFRHF